MATLPVLDVACLHFLVFQLFYIGRDDSIVRQRAGEVLRDVQCDGELRAAPTRPDSAVPAR